MAKVDHRIEGAVAVLTLSNAPVNALAHGVREGLAKAITAANADPAIKAIVITGEGRAFSAGADIAEFRAGLKAPGLPEVIDQIEASTKPVIAAINGLALGGGLEVALGCHYRVAAKGVTQLGLPEVKIGILPGAGGTQRLPRIVGVEPALDLIVSGNPTTAVSAAKVGLVDQLADGDVVVAAIAFAKGLIQGGKGARPTSAKIIDATSVPADVFDKRIAALGKHPSGPMAARHCIEAVRASVGSTYKDGVAKEQKLFAELAASPYAKALQYAFFAERKAADVPDLGPDVKPREVKSVGIIGAGTMGVGIALAFLAAKLPVTLIELQQDALDRAVARIKESIDRDVARKRISVDDGVARFVLLRPSVKLEDLAKVDFIIEAVFEQLAVKKKVFTALDKIAKPGAVLASNTSTLDVDAIASATRRPGDVVGTHFFSPANIMRLLEVVRGQATAKDTLATAMAVAKRIGKVGVVAGNCFGFIGNRMIEEYLEEVQAMMLEGATPTEIDSALEAWGFAMGPNAMMDLAGIDVGYMIRREHKFTAERMQLYAVTDKISEMGRHGQKTGKGYHLYDKDRKRLPDPEVVAMFEKEAEARGITRRKIAPEEIVARCLLRLINEGTKLLDERIAIRPSDIDTIYLTGYGFPAWRGGPMWQAENVLGLKACHERMKALEAEYGPRWKPAPAFERAAKATASSSNPVTAKG
ncbi:MAG: 3-hydroxyacyl-CoA dehydrogenase NAD-binding domain-containing protein [Hyphomicrobiaceae bacterium]